MRERRAQLILFVRAFEEADRDGVLLKHHVRAGAARRALMVTGLADWPGERPEEQVRNVEAVVRRARLLFDALLRKLPPLDSIVRFAQHGSGIVVAVIVLALLIGLSTNALGPRREINLLSFPLLGLLGWNLIVYVGMIAGALWKRRAAHGHRGLAERLASPMLRVALWRSRFAWRNAPQVDATSSAITAKALVRFGAMWHRIAAPLMAMRARRMLHLASIALILGTVGGMYLRGVAFQYRATWESTLLDAPQVQRLLGVVLGPAAMLLGLDLPAVAPLEGPAGSGDAAIWIHLYGLTSLIVVLVPRGLLAGYAGWRSTRLARRLPVDLGDPYFLRSFSAWRGAARRVEILPYSVQLKPGSVDRLKVVLRDFFGARAHVHMHESIGYGDPPPIDLPPETEVAGGDPESPQHCVVLLFNLAQSPEVEVHGAFLEELKARIGERGGRLLVLVDVSSYRHRVQAEDRSTERLAAWRNVVRGSGLTAIDLDLDGPAPESETEMRAALWPVEEAGA